MLVKTSAQGRRVSSWVRYPTDVFIPVTVCPKKEMLPWVGMSSPLTMLSKVDFPQPLGPMTTQNSPSLMLRETSCMASVSTPLRTKVLLTCVTSMVFGSVIFLLRSADQDIVGKGAGPRREPLQHVGKQKQGHPGHHQQDEQIGRAQCRERVGQYV